MLINITTLYNKLVTACQPLAGNDQAKNY